MTVDLLQNGFFRSQDVPKQVGHSAPGLHGQDTEEPEQEKGTRLQRRILWWNKKSKDLPRSLAGLRQIHLSKSAICWKAIVLVAYLALVVWLSSTERERSYARCPKKT